MSSHSNLHSQQQYLKNSQAAKHHQQSESNSNSKTQAAANAILILDKISDLQKQQEYLDIQIYYLHSKALDTLKHSPSLSNKQ